MAQDKLLYLCMTTVAVLVVFICANAANAGIKRNRSGRPYRDVWNHPYKRQTNLCRDRADDALKHILRRGNDGLEG